jgi:hypothetical protein
MHPALHTFTAYISWLVAYLTCIRAGYRFRISVKEVDTLIVGFHILPRFIEVAVATYLLICLLTYLLAAAL